MDENRLGAADHPDLIRQYVLEMLGCRQIRSTPTALEKALRSKYLTLTREQIRSTINKMVIEGDIVYTNHFNTTHLELNFRKPLRVSRRVTLAPNSCTINQSDDGQKRLVLKLHQGSAFGVGDHPTTRLCIQAVDLAMEMLVMAAQPDGIKALDIGTGTGILAMAAAGLGAKSVLGIDIDPAAIYEAVENVRLNRLDHKIAITQTPLESIENQNFNLIMANLRPPTLKDCLADIERLSANESYWVFSGSRAHELERVTAALPAEKTSTFWKDNSCGWTVSIVYWHYQG